KLPAPAPSTIIRFSERCSTFRLVCFDDSAFHKPVASLETAAISGANGEDFGFGDHVERGGPAAAFQFFSPRTMGPDLHQLLSGSAGYSCERPIRGGYLRSRSGWAGLARVREESGFRQTRLPDHITVVNL